MLVTGFDDRQGCGYVLRTGPDATAAAPGTQPVRHRGVVVLATPELAAALRDALGRPPEPLTWGGPPVPLTLDDVTVLAWLRHVLGGVLTVSGGPPPDPRRRP